MVAGFTFRRDANTGWLILKTSLLNRLISCLDHLGAGRERARVPVRLRYLRQKAMQSGHAKANELRDLPRLKEVVLRRIQSIDFKQAKDDIHPFIRDPRELDVWGKEFFSQITEQLEIED
jgi:hypothetical protein